MIEMRHNQSTGMGLHDDRVTEIHHNQSDLYIEYDDHVLYHVGFLENFDEPYIPDNPLHDSQR